MRPGTDRPTSVPVLALLQTFSFAPMFSRCHLFPCQLTFLLLTLEFGEQPKGRVGRHGFESNVARDAKLYFCSAPRSAHNLEFAPDLRGPFLHTGKPPVSLTSKLQHLGTDAAAVIGDKNSQMVGRILQ